MPFSPQYQPRTAEIIMRGAESFGQGIGGGLQNLGGGIGHYLEKIKEEKKEATEKRGWIIATAGVSDENKEAFKNEINSLSLPQLRTRFEELRGRLELEDRQLKRQEIEARIAEAAAQSRQRQSIIDQQGAESRMMQYLGGIAQGGPSTIRMPTGVGMQGPTVQGRMPNIQDAIRAAGQSGASIEPTSRFMEAMARMMPQRQRQPVALELLEAADIEDKLAEAASAAGDARQYQYHKTRADWIRGQGKQEQTTEVTVDPTGSTRMQTRTGPPGTGTTLSTSAAAERKLIGLENVYGIGQLISREIRPQDVGLRGNINELVNKVAPQIGQFVGDLKVTENRQLLRQFRDMALRQINDSPEGRFRNEDRAAINESVSGLELLTSVDEIKTRINRTLDTLKENAITWSMRTNEPRPDWTKSAQDLVAEYITQEQELQKRVNENKITKEQMTAALAVTLKRIQDAGRKYHNKDIRIRP